MKKLKEDIKEAEKAYEEKKTLFEKGLKSTEEHWGEQIEELREKQEKAEELHRKATQEFAETIVARAAPEVAASIAAATTVKAGAAAQRAFEEASLEIEHVEEHLKSDSTLQGLPQLDGQQTKAIAASIQALVAQQLRAFKDGWEQEFLPHESDEEKESEMLPAEEGDDKGFQLTRGQKKSIRRRRAGPNEMVDDSTIRRAAEKRPASEEETEAAEQEKEDAAEEKQTAASSEAASASKPAAKAKTSP